jgi:hypothetical protein
MLEHTKDPDAARIITNLNRLWLKMEEVDRDSVFVQTGQGPSAQMTINQKVKENFPNYALPNLNHPMEESHHIGYSYTHKIPLFKC